MQLKRLIITILALFSLCRISLAWNGNEHRMMAYIAQEHLSPQTQAFLDKYLDQSIVEYSTWMDRYRKSPGYEQTDAWHMVTIDADGRTFVEEEKAPGKAAYALRRAVNILEEWENYDDSTVFINIVYLIHLVPEIHCPSHYYFYGLGGKEGSHDRNFQTLKLNGKNASYHAIWDSSITTLNPGLTLDLYRERFDNWSEEEQKAVSEGSVEDWIRENAAKVRPIYDWADAGDRIDDSFLKSHRDLPESMVAPAGYRLARLLNDLFGK